MNAAANRDKWVHEIRAIDSVAIAARLTLHSRLSSVGELLGLAACHGDQTTEHVHQLRVSTRRSLAALQIYKCVLPNSEAKWFRKRLNQIRKAAGQARDLDVFLARYQNHCGPGQRGFLRQIKRRRAKAHRPIGKLHQKLICDHRFERHVHNLLNEISSAPSPCEQSLEDLARSAVDEMTDRLFAAAPRKREPSLKQLHRFRIRGKELRYVMELFSPLFPSGSLKPPYRHMKRLQNRLGTLCDHASACQQLADWRKKTASPRKTKYLLRLEDRERQALQESIRDFSAWWSPTRAKKLRAALSAIADAKA